MRAATCNLKEWIKNLCSQGVVEYLPIVADLEVVPPGKVLSPSDSLIMKTFIDYTPMAKLNPGLIALDLVYYEYNGIVCAYLLHYMSYTA